MYIYSVYIYIYICCFSYWLFRSVRLPFGWFHFQHLDSSVVEPLGVLECVSSAPPGKNKMLHLYYV